MKPKDHGNWADEFDVAITISDLQGTILYMNDKSASTFEKYGGRELTGTSLKNCHKPESWEKIVNLIDKRKTNCYTIEKEGVKKLIYQAPWYINGEACGLVELSVVLPEKMEHFFRK